MPKLGPSQAHKSGCYSKFKDIFSPTVSSQYDEYFSIDFLRARTFSFITYNHQKQESNIDTLGFSYSQIPFMCSNCPSNVLSNKEIYF